MLFRSVDGALIDVADYTHLPTGPQALLVAHEAHYAIDGSGPGVGLAYARKRGAEPTGQLADRLAADAGTLVRAAQLLESDPEAMPNGTFRFRSDEIAFAANDRLAAPDVGETEAALRSALDTFGERVFGGSVEVEPASDAPHLGFRIRFATPVPLAQQLENLNR